MKWSKRRKRRKARKIKPDIDRRKSFRKRKKWKKKKKKRSLPWKRILLIAFSPLIIFAIVLGAARIRNRIRELRPGPSSGVIGLCLSGGDMTISWPSSAGMDACRLYQYDKEKGDYVACGEFEGNQAKLTGIRSGEELQLRLQAVHYINVLGHKFELSGYQRTVKVTPAELPCPVLTKRADTENKRVFLSWQADPGSTYEVYLLDEENNERFYSMEENGAVEMAFDDGTQGIAMPDRENPVRVLVRALRREENYILYSVMSDIVEISRKDLFSDQMNLTWEKTGECQYVLRWEESKGETYELQEWSYDENSWITRGTYPWSAELKYETGRLPSCTQIHYRVITYDDKAQRDKGNFAAEPSNITFRSELSSLYCSIWPIVPLDLTSDAAGGDVIGQIPAGESLCVLGEENDRFRVRYQNEYGYVDARFCMINLPEYLGNLCQYNITNSYSSIFRVHGYDIPEITDSVVKGYDNIYLEEDGYLVPYLYPCSKKIYEAAINAGQDGYCLCIYDAFRPNEATRYLYDTVESMLDDEVPEEGEEPEEEKESLPEAASAVLGALSPEGMAAVKGMSQEAVTAMRELPVDVLKNPYELSPETLSTMTPEMAAVFMSLSPEDFAVFQRLTAEEIGALNGLSPENLSALQVHLAEDKLTYRKVMTDNRYRLGSFLAAVTSAHNRGIAVDLTLTDMQTGKSLEMQSDMHDLSWYSALSQNNDNAKLLAGYMKGAGLRDLSSEWWHFQDDETRYAIGLNSYLDKGVSVEGWKKDDKGWRYRLADGSYYRDVTADVDGISYTFDADGYQVGGDS